MLDCKMKSLPVVRRPVCGTPNTLPTWASCCRTCPCLSGRLCRIVAYLLASSLPYRYAWCAKAATELATLAFYATTALAFRPAAENPYLSFADDELDLDELRERGEI